MYAEVNTTTGVGKSHREVVRKSIDYRTLKLLAIGSAQGVLSQKIETTEETWTGLSKSDAVALCIASVSSVLNGTTRQYLGGVKITVGGGGITTWATIDECWGTRVKTNIQRMGDTNMYFVSRTTEVMNVYGKGGTITLL